MRALLLALVALGACAEIGVPTKLVLKAADGEVGSGTAPRRGGRPVEITVAGQRYAGRWIVEARQFPEYSGFGNAMAVDTTSSVNGSGAAVLRSASGDPMRCGFTITRLNGRGVCVTGSGKRYDMLMM